MVEPRVDNERDSMKAGTQKNPTRVPDSRGARAADAVVTGGTETTRRHEARGDSRALAEIDELQSMAFDDLAGKVADRMR